MPLVRSIETENAVIKTASVEVKCLTISGKQVTLAVFRQLPNESLIDENCNLRGIPWGIVNYCPDKECSHIEGHFHVVWQLGNQLNRATVLRDAVVTRRYKQLLHKYEEAEVLLVKLRNSLWSAILFDTQASLTRSASGNIVLITPQLPSVCYSNPPADFQTFESFKAQMSTKREENFQGVLKRWENSQEHLKNSECRKTWCWQCDDSKEARPVYTPPTEKDFHNAWISRMLYRDQGNARRTRVEYDPALTVDDMHCKVLAAKTGLSEIESAMDAFQNAYTAQIETLLQLPQLFIAV